MPILRDSHKQDLGIHFKEDVFLFILYRFPKKAILIIVFPGLLKKVDFEEAYSILCLSYI